MRPPLRVVDPFTGVDDLPAKAPTALTVIETVTDYIELEGDAIVEYAREQPERVAEIVNSAMKSLKSLTATLLGAELTR